VNTCVPTAPRFPRRMHAHASTYARTQRRDKRRVLIISACSTPMDGRMDERTNEQMPGGQGGAPSTCPNKARRSSERADFSRDFSRASSNRSQGNTPTIRGTIAHEFLKQNQPRVQIRPIRVQIRGAPRSLRGDYNRSYSEKSCKCAKTENRRRRMSEKERRLDRNVPV